MSIVVVVVVVVVENGSARRSESGARPPTAASALDQHQPASKTRPLPLKSGRKERQTAEERARERERESQRRIRRGTVSKAARRDDEERRPALTNRNQMLGGKRSTKSVPEGWRGRGAGALRLRPAIDCRRR